VQGALPKVKGGAQTALDTAANAFKIKIVATTQNKGRKIELNWMLKNVY